ncbi:hypothetical protein AVEN_166953-1 [Araneus ventricosus]|uniref:Uncharacterized protein n=1 Tax=Araneus ventricosus TaxID=182803 RepID=A0A4Y2QQX7_ARAVE|nr:hypothetical protein AVEN_166953-1 [Araneus ventricosus]
MKQLMDKTPMDLVEDVVARNFLENKISVTVEGFKSIHSSLTWCGLLIQFIDATFSKSFQYFCCKKSILKDICFAVAQQQRARVQLSPERWRLNVSTF